MAVFATDADEGESAAKIPPVCSQREPPAAKICCQSKSPGWQLAIAVFPRSEHPTADRRPNPRSVKFRPLRTVLPIPSYRPADERCVDSSLQHQVLDQLADWIPGQRFNDGGAHAKAPSESARNVIFCAPSQARKFRAVWMRSSPGSSRSMTSPRLTQSHRQPSSAFRMIGFIPAF